MLPGPVTLGVRPQHMRVAAADAVGALPVTLYALEHLGRESVVIADDPAGNRLRALVDPGFKPRIGDKLGMIADPAFHLFFGADGRRLV
jgi:hypothetical protein